MKLKMRLKNHQSKLLLCHIVPVSAKAITSVQHVVETILYNTVKNEVLGIHVAQENF